MTVLSCVSLQIVELEDGIIILKEDLIQERNNHRIEKTRLKDLTVSSQSDDRNPVNKSLEFVISHDRSLLSTQV